MKHSDSIKEISLALVAAQTKLNNPGKDAANPFFNSKYTTLAALIDHVKPGLAEHGLAIVQGNSEGERGINIDTLIMHTSGEWIESTLQMPVAKQDPQAAGSAITYGRRYALAAILNIASEDDDDANSATPVNSPTQVFDAQPSTHIKPSGANCTCAFRVPVQQTAKTGKPYHVCKTCAGFVNDA